MLINYKNFLYNTGVYKWNLNLYFMVGNDLTIIVKIVIDL